LQVYISEVCDVLSIAMAELPNLLPPPEVAEMLLRLRYGPEMICHIVANQPDSFRDGKRSTATAVFQLFKKIVEAFIFLKYPQ
jgi:hypothetical protein